MTRPVQLYCWHFMSYPYLPADFDERYETGWVTVPNRLWDAERSRGLYQEYIDQLVYADEIGFDGMVLNEHHQNIYGLMPSPNLIAAALSQRTKRGKIVILGNLLPLHLNPLRMAEEYAMLDNMTDGRLIAGFAPGVGPETFNYDVPSAPSREQFWEAVDLIHRAWTEDGPFACEGAIIRCATSIRGRGRRRSRIRRSGSRARARPKRGQIAKRGYCYFLSSRSHGSETARAQAQFAKVLEEHGSRFDPFRMGILMSAYVGRNRCAGADGSQGRRLVLPQELPQGTSAARRPHAHLRAGHSLHSPVRIPQLSEILRSQRAAAR